MSQVLAIISNTVTGTGNTSVLASGNYAIESFDLFTLLNPLAAGLSGVTMALQAGGLNFFIADFFVNASGAGFASASIPRYNFFLPSPLYFAPATVITLNCLSFSNSNSLTIRGNIYGFTYV